MWKSPHLNVKKIELLVCIYEVLGELVFKYGISGCSRCLTLETIMNPLPSQETVIPKPSKPCVTLQAISERCV